MNRVKKAARMRYLEQSVKAGIIARNTKPEGWLGEWFQEWRGRDAAALRELDENRQVPNVYEKRDRIWHPWKYV